MKSNDSFVSKTVSSHRREPHFSMNLQILVVKTNKKYLHEKTMKFKFITRQSQQHKYPINIPWDILYSNLRTCIENINLYHFTP